MTRPWRIEPRRAALSIAIIFWLLPAAVLAGGLREPKTLIELYESSDLVVRGTIDTVVLPQGSRAVVADVQVHDRIKGDDSEAWLRVARELFFPSDEPVLREGTDAILFLNVLPVDSRWNELRIDGVAYVTADQEAGVSVMGLEPLAQTASFLRRYAELSNLGGESRRRQRLDLLLRGLGSPLFDVQEASSAALTGLESLASSLEPEDRTALRRFVSDHGASTRARGRLLHRLSFLDDYEALLAQIIVDDPAMRPAALDAIQSRKGVSGIPKVCLDACLADADERVRLGALTILSGSPRIPLDRKELLETAALEDASSEVRAMAMTLAGTHGGEPFRDILGRGLADESAHVVYSAADNLRRLGGEGSVKDLSGLLASENPKTRFIGILMLGSMDDDLARHILEEASKGHSDAGARELCTKALASGGLDADSFGKLLGFEPFP